jgi:hypothetical protein
MLLIDQSDRLYRLALAKFARMLQDPTNYRIPLFASQRIRTASAIVECVDREPLRIIRITFDILSFDAEGHFEASRFIQQQASRAELAMAPVIAGPHVRTPVIQAATQFVELGGRWVPSRAMSRAIDDAVFGRTKCPRV